MASFEPFVAIWGTVCVALTLLLFFAPKKTIDLIILKKSSDGFNFLQFYSIWVNCFLGLILGTLFSDYSLVIVNFIGLNTSSFFVFTFWKYTHDYKAKQKIYILVVCAIVGVISCIYHIMNIPFEDAQLFIGYLSIITSMVVFAAPLVDLAKVIRTRDASSIPIYQSSVASLSCCCWFIYSLMIDNIFVGFPNVIGALLSFFQVFLYYTCNSKENFASSLPT